MKETTNLISDIFGNSLLLTCFCTVCYFAGTPETFLSAEATNAEKVGLIYYAVTNIIWLVLAAEFQTKVQQSVQTWIGCALNNDKLQGEDRIVLMTLSNESFANPIAFASKYFSVSYGFLGQVSNLLARVLITDL